MKKLITFVVLSSILVSCSHSVEKHRGVRFKGEIDGIEIINYDNIGNRFYYEGYHMQDKNGTQIILEDNDESKKIGDYIHDRYVHIKEGVKKKIPVEKANKLYKQVESDVLRMLIRDFDTLV